MDKSALQIYCDGGSRGNPGPAASGAVIVENNKVIATKQAYLGITTNNQAEYKAVLLGFELMREAGSKSANFFLDSQLVVRQLNGQYKVKDAGLKPIYLKIMNERKKFEVDFTFIRREFNKHADAAVNECLDNQSVV